MGKKRRKGTIHVGEINVTGMLQKQRARPISQTGGAHRTEVGDARRDRHQSTQNLRQGKWS